MKKTALIAYLLLAALAHGGFTERQLAASIEYNYASLNLGGPNTTEELWGWARDCDTASVEVQEGSGYFAGLYGLVTTNDGDAVIIRPIFILDCAAGMESTERPTVTSIVCHVDFGLAASEWEIYPAATNIVEGTGDDPDVEARFIYWEGQTALERTLVDGTHYTLSLLPDQSNAIRAKTPIFFDLLQTQDVYNGYTTGYTNSVVATNLWLEYVGHQRQIFINQ